MGLYLYAHPKTKKVVEVVQSMNDVHEFIDEKGVKYDRVWVNPQVAFDSSFVNVDPYDSKSFVKKTSKGGDTIDSLWSRSQELHEKRGGAGKDEIKEAYYADYAKKRSGQKHDDVKKREVADKLKRVGIKITPD